MFDLRGNERLLYWKQFRDSLEISPDPLTDCVNWWVKAPFVSPFLDPLNPKTWPDPWHLVLDDRYDDLAIVLGMYYTLELTDRFKEENMQIYMRLDEKEKRYFILIGEKLMNLYHGQVSNKDSLNGLMFDLIFTRKANSINI